jgi:hypothetical protein
MNYHSRPFLANDEIDGPEVLKKMYGELWTQMRNKAISRLNPNALTSRAIEPGICVGQCLCFAAKFLNEISFSRTNWITAVEQSSALFKNGGPAEAEIIQILHEATINRLAQVAIETIEKKIDSVENAGGIVNITEQEKVNCAVEACRRGLRLSAKKQLNLQILPVGSLTVKNVKATIQDLMPGLYFVNGNARPSEREGHVMLYIKESEDRAYFFDPNYGTNMLETIEEQIEMFNQKVGYGAENTLHIEKCQLLA